ncbi:CAP domain-containing protein [Streptomyces sp. NPDC049906]|uniref:CAP domain-containing protein n=1 Tax=Streptomyces sp. NPDC049906 TaxID=3155656 RepID=UPI003413C381
MDDVPLLPPPPASPTPGAPPGTGRRPVGGHRRRRARTGRRLWGALAVIAALGAGTVAAATAFGTPAGVAAGAARTAALAPPPPGGPDTGPESPAPRSPATPTPEAAPAPTDPGTPPRQATPEPSPVPAGTTAPAAEPAPQGAPSPARPRTGRSGAGSGMVAQVTALVNSHRVRAGCRPVTADARLNRAAVGHSRDMGLRGYFDHVSPQGTDVGDRVTAQGYAWSIVGENVAAGPRTAAAAVRGWLESPGHRANILNCSFVHMGLGIEGEHGSPGGPHWTQVFAAPAH